MSNDDVYKRESEVIAHCLNTLLSLQAYINDMDYNRGKERASVFTLPMLYGIASQLDGAMHSVEYYYDLRVTGEPRKN